MSGFSRRGVLSAMTGLSAVAAADVGWAADTIAPQVSGIGPAEPFPLRSVRLKPSMFLDSVETNRRYLLSLEPDRLLHNFRLFAGLEPRGERYGGWEAQGIAGHSLGHYQSGLSLIHAQTGDETVRERALYISRELAAVQARHGDGYAGGTTVERDGEVVDGKIVFEEVRRGDIRTSGFDLNGGWVPIYTYHKVFAGLLDSHRHCGDALALEVAVGLADYLGTIVEGLTDDQVQQVLRAEHGGINESYAELHARTGDARWLRIAERLRHRAVLDPLAEGRNELAGKHANTQIPKLIGLARLYEVSPTAQNRHDCAAAAQFFWETVTRDHTYVIGGNSNHEHFGEPGRLARELGQQTCEACNSYNMLRLTRHLYAWSGDARHFDFYERAHLNHIMSQQHPVTGMFSYFTPLASGFGRVRSSPDDSFWCCVGSGMESHSKHGDSIWWRQGDRVLVNLYYPSSLDWREKGAALEMETGFPLEETVRIRVAAAEDPVDLGLRIPAWCAAPTVRVNARPARATRQDRYLMLDRLRAGDEIELSLPMALHRETMPDDDRLEAYLYGPLVLAADLGPASEPREEFDPVIVAGEGGADLHRLGNDVAFSTAEESRPEALVLKPFFSQYDNRTAVYFRRFTSAEWPVEQAAYLAKARELAEARARTIDVIRLGEMQPERDHSFSGTPNTATVTHIAERGRLINKGYFQFRLAVRPEPVELRVVYDGPSRNKDFALLIDGELLARERLPGEPTVERNTVTYPIPDRFLSGENITVRFEADSDQWTTVYECRTVSAGDATAA